MASVFLLGEKAHKIIDYVPVRMFSVGPVSVEAIEKLKPTHIICFGYRHLIRSDVIRAMPENSIINLHPSFLPWGRGAHPNYWAWKRLEPHGVTIHAIDEGLDTGPIFVQRQVYFDNQLGMTLAETYRTIEEEMIDMFKDHIVDILSGALKPCPQISASQSMGIGSFHRVKELPELKEGWNTKISTVMGYE